MTPATSTTRRERSEPTSTRTRTTTGAPRGSASRPDATEAVLVVDLRDASGDRFGAGSSSVRAVVEEFGATLGAFHPVGFRAMAHAASEDLSAVLPTITVPTLLVYGSEDTRAPLPIAQHLHAAIPGSVLVVLPDVGHLCNLEAPHQFNSAVRRFLAESQSG